MESSTHGDLIVKTFLLQFMLLLFGPFARLFLPCAGYEIANMNRMHTGTVGLWVYRTTDAIATVIASGYFNEKNEVIKKGDIILCTSTLGGTVAVDVLVVDSADGAAVVTVNNGT
jgi:hypothetical protein